jgi:hypothetical protein
MWIYGLYLSIGILYYMKTYYHHSIHASIYTIFLRVILILMLSKLGFFILKHITIVVLAHVGENKEHHPNIIVGPWLWKKENIAGE